MKDRVRAVLGDGADYGMLCVFEQQSDSEGVKWGIGCGGREIDGQGDWCGLSMMGVWCRVTRVVAGSLAPAYLLEPATLLTAC